jgi:preprotein translocase subunit SecY
VVALLTLARLIACIPIPGIEFDSLTLTQGGSDDLGMSLLENLAGPQPFFTIGSLGLIPYLNSSTTMAVLSSVVPAFSRLQNEQGESGRQEIIKYIRYLNLLLSIIVSTYCSFVLLKPGIFNWSFALGCQIIFSLVMGSMSYMWILELMNNEAIVNDCTSLLLLVNSLVSWPISLSETISDLSQFSFLIGFCILFGGFWILLLVVVSLAAIVTSEKRISLASAKQLNFNYLKKLYKQPSNTKDAYIPVRICAGGLMPVVMTVSSAPLLVSLLGGLLSKYLVLSETALLSVGSVMGLLGLIFCSIYYGLFAVRPQSLADNLQMMAFGIPGVRPGIETKKYLQQVVTRTSFMGALVVVFWFLPVGFFSFSLGGSLVGSFVPIVIFFSTFMEFSETITFATEYNEFFPKRL